MLATWTFPWWALMGRSLSQWLFGHLMTCSMWELTTSHRRKVEFDSYYKTSIGNNLQCSNSDLDFVPFETILYQGLSRPSCLAWTFGFLCCLWRLTAHVPDVTPSTIEQAGDSTAYMFAIDQMHVPNPIRHTNSHDVPRLYQSKLAALLLQFD